MYFSLLQIIYGALFLYLPIPNSASNRKTTRGSSNALFSVTSSTVLLNSVHLNTITDHQSPFETPRQADPNNHQPGIPPNLTHPKLLYPLTHPLSVPISSCISKPKRPHKKTRPNDYQNSLEFASISYIRAEALDRQPKNSRLIKPALSLNISQSEDLIQNGLPSSQPILSRGKLDGDLLDRSIEIGCLSSGDSLSLFRPYSMPIQISSSTGSDDEGPADRSQDDLNQDEDDDDYEELLITPTSQLLLHNPSSYSPHQSTGQRLLSCSLPPSLSRRKSNTLQHENPLHELLQLTQPMREGVISRERLLPSSRMKQIGVGGRGRRAMSIQKNPSSPSGFNPLGSESFSPPKVESSALVSRHIMLTNPSD
ncbi:hypothetical protein PSHT_04893 [Puccinia striiformis]|uniref:Uncharacterized protein n=1 Tax=Puccinia striiformis TaxID=27350 RepID=A0A2S4WBY9_9BASI|nr:hypothetical protein PSHT_04893 [Puccinia striiformis]